MNVYPLKCRISAEAQATRVDVYDDIGPGGWFDEGLTAKSFTAQLAGVKGALEVHINSGGGDVFDGIAIGNALQAHKGPVTVVVDGLAASIASVIAQAGAERVMQPGSMMMIHDAFGVCVGDAAEMAKMAETLDQVSGNLASIYAERAGKTEAHWRGQMREETWYTAEQAVDAGLADRVGDGRAELPAGLDVAAFAAPGQIAAALRSLPKAAAGPSSPQNEEHGAFDGPHTHAHPSYGAAGEDGPFHTHEHVHENESNHNHDHEPDADDQVGARLDARIAAAVTHLANAAVDESAWDGPAAMSAASKADDPAAALNAICAGKREGDPKTQAAHALPHHKHAGDPPNRAGVSAALGRIDGTQGLTNRDAAEAHLKAHQAAMGGDHGAGDHSDTGWLHDLLEGVQ